MPKHGSPGYQHIEQDDYSDGVLEEVWAWVEKHGVDPHDVIRISETEEEPLTIPEMLDAVLDIETRQLRAMARDELIKAADQIAALEAEAGRARAEAKTMRDALVELMRWTNESPPQWLDYEMHDEYRAAVNQAKDAVRAAVAQA